MLAARGRRVAQEEVRRHLRGDAVHQGARGDPTLTLTLTLTLTTGPDQARLGGVIYAASASRNPDAKSTSNAKAADREPNLTLTTDPDH